MIEPSGNLVSILMDVEKGQGTDGTGGEGQEKFSCCGIGDGSEG